MSEPALPPQGEEIHRYGHGIVDQHPKDDGAALQAQGAQDNPRQDGRHGLGKGLTDMHQAIGNGHHEDRIKAEPVFKPVQHKSPEEKLDGKKLQEIGQLPPEKHGEKGPLCRVEQGIALLEGGVGGGNIDQRQHDHQHQQVEGVVLLYALQPDPVVGKAVPEDKRMIMPTQ